MQVDSEVASLPAIEVDASQVQKVFDKHYDSGVVVNGLAALQTGDYSSAASRRCYIIDCTQRSEDKADSSQSCFLLVSRPPVSAAGSDDLAYHGNSLEVNHHLLSLIAAQVHPPVPTLPPIIPQRSASFSDTSLDILPYHYIITPLNPFPSTAVVALSEAKRLDKLSPENLAAIDLRLGHFFGQLHSQVQNDWYGMPAMPTIPNASSSFGGLPGLSIAINEPPHESGYSWQETFTALIEDLLSRLKGQDNGNNSDSFPYEDVHKYLSRAIGSFLFDDVEVPSLIWFTMREEDIYIFDPDATSDPAAAGTIATILPAMTHAIWGDPLLEYFMLGSGGLPVSDDLIPQPSEAFMKGYRAGGGQNLIVFPRHKTKRIWYTIFLALVVLVGEGVRGEPGTEDESRQKRKHWAREVLEKGVEKLKNSPCY